jgi:hypothetical protein
MSQFVRLLQNGFMDKDTDLQLVSGGNYIDGQNIRHRDDSGANMTGISPVKGNSLEVTIPDPTSSITSWRVYIRSQANLNGSISVIDTSGALLGPANFTGTITPTTLLVSSIDITLDRITFGAAHGLVTGQAVVYNNVFGVPASPLINGTTYYVNVINSTTIELFTDSALLNKVNITSTGSGLSFITVSPLITISNQVQSMLTGLNAGFIYGPLVYLGAETAYFDVTHSFYNDFEILEGGNLIDFVVQTSEYVNFLSSAPPNFKIIGMESVVNDTIVFSTTSNSLASSYYTPYNSLCEIGVVQFNPATDSYSYTRLLRSKQLNFNVDYQIQAQVEKRTQDVNIYWTDGLNKPRVLSVPYPYVQDGVLTPNGGTIDIAKVDKETTLFVDTPSASIQYISMIEGGGSLLCGNKRYTGRFLTDDFVGTDYLYPTGPLNVFKAPTNTPSEIKGDQPGTLTNKSINLRINNIPSGEFAYFELVALEYEGETFVAKTVQRYRLGSETSIDVSHTNNGQDNFPLSLPELLALTAKVTRVQSLKINSNRLFLANVDELVDKNLTLWAQKITHSLELKTITSVAKSNRFGKNDCNKTYPAYQFGEYQDPQNVLSNVGYMMNDTYRFGIQVQWKETGKWSTAYWLDDIRFDTSASNVTLPNRRSANNITTTNFTDLSSSAVNIVYPRFGNIDLNFIVDNQPLHKLIKAYRIVRADRIPEVLATGILIGGVQDDNNVGAGHLIPYHKDVVRTPTFTFSTYPFNFCRRDHGINFRTSAYQNDIFLGTTSASNYGYFHSPDLYFNQVDYEYSPGDKLNVLSVPIPTDELTLQGFSTGDYESVYQEYTGYFDNTLRSYTPITILDARNFRTGEVSPWDVFAKVKNGISVPPEGRTYANVNPFFSNMKSCTVFKLDTAMASAFPGETGLFPTGSGTYSKEGLVYCQIFRDKGNAAKYPVDKKQTVYESTNHIYILNGTERGVQNNVSVFGGDVFTQKSHLKVRMSTYNQLNNGFGLAYSFYSQNITNTQMFYTLDHNKEHAGPGYVFPQYMETTITGLNELGYNYSRLAFIRDWSPTFTVPSIASNVVTYAQVPQGSWAAGLMYWLEQWPEVDNQNNYDSQYSIIDNSITENGYDADNRWDGKRPASIRWSQIKSTGSEKDNYRVFKPIDVVDLDTNEGDIVELETINGNLYTLQPNAFTRHFVGDSQMQMTDQGTEIILGSGGVLTNKGQKLSSFGATKKTSVVKGKTFSGDENLYWYNSDTKKIVRFGGDGTRVLSDKGLMSFLINNTAWHTDNLIPISGQGVTAGYNQRFYEAYFTFKAINPSGELLKEFQTYTDATYTAIKQYPVNTLVYVSHQGDGTNFNYYAEYDTASRHISGLPFIYRKKDNNGTPLTDTINTVPFFGANWTNNWQQLSPDTHPQYYSLFTLVYDEVKNGFICFHSMWPNIMTTRTNTIYTSKPNEQNKIYVHNSGSYNTFYDVQYNGHIEGVANIDPNMSKTFEAVQVVSDITPDRVDFGTRDHVSFLTSAEFEELEDFYYAPVKNDSTVTGVNSGDTSRLWGRYLKIKMRFAPNVFQKLINYVIKYRVNPRLYNK